MSHSALPVQDLRESMIPVWQWHAWLHISHMLWYRHVCLCSERSRRRAVLLMTIHGRHLQQTAGA